MPGSKAMMPGGDRLNSGNSKGQGSGDHEEGPHTESSVFSSSEATLIQVEMEPVGSRAGSGLRRAPDQPKVGNERRDQAKVGGPTEDAKEPPHQESKD